MYSHRRSQKLEVRGMAVALATRWLRSLSLSLSDTTDPEKIYDQCVFNIHLPLSITITATLRTSMNLSK